MTDIPFPSPIRRNGRLYWLRSELERHKRELIAASRGVAVVNEAPPAIEQLVGAPQVALEFGYSRRTLGRAIRDVA